MSINEPQVQISQSGKKRSSESLSFYVEDEYIEYFDDQPAWLLTNHVEAAREIGDTR